MAVAEYVELGGGKAIGRAHDLGPGGTVQEVALSGLRGRGGAGFPTGRKWETVHAAHAAGSETYAVCNAAEGEPGTFKDRSIIRRNPFQVLEGLAVAAFAVGARQAFVGLKDTFSREAGLLRDALEELRAAGIAGDIPIEVVEGPDAYLLGEETGLLEAIEGNAPLPRLLPPYLHGLFAQTPQIGLSGAGPVRHAREWRPPDAYSASNPTLVNNVETLANVPAILVEGPEWHRGLGTEQSPGIQVCTVVGDVRRPGVGEVEMGTPLAEVIDRVGGGVHPKRRVKAVLSGVANPALTADQLETPVSYEGMEAAGSGLGAAGFVVYDDTTDMVEVARVVSRFLHVESCGQCPACKLGTEEITGLLDRVAAGAAEDDDVERIGARLRTVTDGNRCYLPVQEQVVIASLLRAFPEDFARALEGTPVRLRGLPIAKLADLAGGVATYDERQAHKRPDWTYANP